MNGNQWLAGRRKNIAPNRHNWATHTKPSPIA